MKESFLPFWAMSAEVTVLLKGAQVGWDSWQPVYNPATRQALMYSCSPLASRKEKRVTEGQCVRAAAHRVFMCARAQAHVPYMQSCAGVCSQAV